MEPHEPPDRREGPGGLAEEPALRALADLVAVAEQMAEVTALIREHAAEIRACRAQGLPYREIVARERRPLIVEVLTDATARFEAAGTRFRQAKAAALRQEGLTLEEIGALFGLTRQRISRLLQEADGADPGRRAESRDTGPIPAELPRPTDR
ncbi:sigma factor-like helix-turn-helix DNA-binding protein [Geodermatophilus sp. SYSU D01186]